MANNPSAFEQLAPPRQPKIIDHRLISSSALLQRHDVILAPSSTLYASRIRTRAHTPRKRRK